MTETENHKERMEFVVQQAIAAVADSGRPIDLLVMGVDDSPGALDLPEMEQPCSRRRPAVDTCPDCGGPVCADCLGLKDDEGSF